MFVTKDVSTHLRDVYWSIPIFCRRGSGAYVISKFGMYFLISAESSSGVKLIAVILYVRIFSHSFGHFKKSTVARMTSGK